MAIRPSPMYALNQLSVQACKSILDKLRWDYQLVEKWDLHRKYRYQLLISRVKIAEENPKILKVIGGNTKTSVYRHAVALAMEKQLEEYQTTILTGDNYCKLCGQITTIEGE